MAIIMVTGANGQLGSELRELTKSYAGYEFLFTDTEDLDITSADQVNNYIKANTPSWIINCAAYTDVDNAERERDKAFAVNEGGVINIVNAIAGSECRFIHISTDYVFDGTSNRPYTETHYTNPVTEYGKSKLAGEEAALKHPRTMIIRTSWLYSSYGHNFVKTIINLLEKGNEPRVVFDQTGTPTYAAGLAQTIMNIISGVIRHINPLITGIYHYSDEGVCSWYDIAVAIVSAAGSSRTITPCLSEEFPQIAKRPAYSVLDKHKIKEDYNITIPHWRDNITGFVRDYQ